MSENSKCDNSNSKCDRTQKHQMCNYSKTQNVTKQNSKDLKCDKTKKLKMGQN